VLPTPSTAIEYLVPDTILTADMETVFQPTAGELSVSLTRKGARVAGVVRNTFGPLCGVREEYGRGPTWSYSE
jgi:hypothetical protein